ncbi:7732_t:CDS:1 [Racocetra persica]|uniref:7732_t:CDS:1 n=1 Tax=Racocetra persica TaxID=160502 RepID=A0ACA9NU59_9GLOM|nr:7732_t:CDS:1 [Racocetra persica]
MSEAIVDEISGEESQLPPSHCSIKKYLSSIRVHIITSMFLESLEPKLTYIKTNYIKEQYKYVSKEDYKSMLALLCEIELLTKRLKLCHEQNIKYMNEIDLLYKNNRRGCGSG